MLTSKKYFLILTLIHVQVNVSSVKVCKNWTDYWNFFGDNSCKQDLDADDDFVGIVTRWGKKVDTYEVLTYDGYILTIFRILPENDKASPVLLVHGGFINPLALVDRGKKSLAHQFVEAGYDVYLISLRGTKYSRRHIAFSSKESSFWKFSFHEWGVYDIPAALMKIGEMNDEKVLIVGYELGSTSSLIYAAENPDAPDHVSGIISLSPLTVPTDAGIAAKTLIYSAQFFIVPMLKFFYHGELPAIVRNFRASRLCSKSGILVARTCDAYFESFSGLDVKQQDPETLPVIVALNKDSEPAKNFEHIYQILRYKRFVKFDYGPAKNLILYNQKVPPLYDFEKINVPQIFIVGPNDKFATPKDTLTAFHEFKPEYQKKYHLINYRKFGSADFVQAKDINRLLHADLIQMAATLAPPSS